MIGQESAQQKQAEEESGLSYQSRKLLHMIELQILDIESTLHYIQKKHTLHQLKEALSQIYNIFNETEPLFRTLKAAFLHQEIKKIMNCFGIIYVILMNHLHKPAHAEALDAPELTSHTKHHKQNCEASNQPAKQQLNLLNSQQKTKPSRLGGVYLYNQQYKRHLQNEDQYRKIRFNKMQKTLKDLSKDELSRMVVEEINDTSHLATPPDHVLDIFSFKFKYGKENQIVTFHDELLEIANFFKQSQNEAFEFLNKTKDQTSIITYNDSFRDVMAQIKKEKEEKLKIFTDKIKAAFGSIKSKTEQKVAEMENKLTVMEVKQHSKEVNRHERETQTVLNIDEEMKSLKRRLADSEEKYRIMMQFKKKELEENTMIGLELESEIGLKNREIVYLKLNVEENALMINNLNKRIKFLTDSNRKIKDYVRNAEEPGKIMEAVENKEEADKFMKEEADDQLALESLRKQRKMAKKILLEKRKSSLLGGEKAQFMKRFTQQMDSAKMTPNELLSRNLSEINEGDSQVCDEDNFSAASNKNGLLVEELSRPYQRKKTKKISIIPDSRGEGSSHSINSRHSLNAKSKKVLKEKRTSEVVEASNRTSLLNKMKETPQSINEDSVLDECSEDEKDFMVGSKQEKLSVNSEEYSKIEAMFRKQMSRTKNIIGNNKRFSSFNSASSRTPNKSYFSSQKQNTQESVPNSALNKNSARSKHSFRNVRQEEEVRSSFHRFSKKIDNQGHHTPESVTTSVHPSVHPSQDEKIVKKDATQAETRKLCLYSSQFNISIEPVEKAEDCIQTEKKKNTETDEGSSLSQFKNATSSNNTIHISRAKDTIIFTENQTASQLMTRSATQSKMSKNRHLKTLYAGAGKQNEKYLFSKNTEKSVDEQFKNSHSCLQMQEDVEKQLERAAEGKRDTAPDPAEKLREEREVRKLAIKCRTLQEFKARVLELHRQRCGHQCTHLQKFVQNYIKYKQETKPKMRMPVKNLTDNIALTLPEDDDHTNYFPALERKKN